ncbi:MAG: hypothetical protein AB7P08_17350 [Burkholderiales bacterium]
MLRIRALLLCLALSFASIAGATSFTDYLENKIVDWLLRGQAFSPPATVYVGLLTAGCSDSAAGTEVTGGSYARASVASSLANWAGTQSAGSTTASSGTSGTTSNNNAIPFPAPTANWGVVTHFGIYDAASAGNLLICQALTVSKTINNGDAAPVFNAAALTIQVDN